MTWYRVAVLFLFQRSSGNHDETLRVLGNERQHHIALLNEALAAIDALVSWRPRFPRLLSKVLVVLVFFGLGFVKRAVENVQKSHRKRDVGQQKK